MEYETTWGGGGDGEEGPWTEVQYQKNRKSRGNGVEMTFLVQNLPDRASKTTLWQAFQPHGFVSDAYVARKKDKRGNWFGFIRYVGVENVESTLVAMNTVKIFEAKVTVSLAKYDKNHKKFIYTSKVVGEKVWKPKGATNLNPQNKNGSSSGNATFKEGVSFANLFQKDVQVNNLGSKTITVDGKGSKYPLHCTGRSIHGVVKDLRSFNSLNQILSNGGLRNFGLSYIGGLSFLLTLGNPGMVKEVMANHTECLSSVFSRFHVWKGEDLPMDRIANLRITWIPVHLRDNSLFDRIGGLYGMVLQSSSFSWQSLDNSLSSVLVLVPHGKRIEESVVLNWEERRYVVWVTEDFEIWKPNLDGEFSQGDPGGDMSDDSDGFSVGENNEENNQKFDDFEEGEFIPPTECQPEPEGDFRPISESQNIRDYEELPIDDQLECEKSAGMGKSVREPMMKPHGLHGKISHMGIVIMVWGQ
ncbi:putative RNA recognition motif domain, nucleotide-binding alpha-beta plait domain superfamily [Helianthus debilis subsp. tardiflorus]